VLGEKEQSKENLLDTEKQMISRAKQLFKVVFRAASQKFGDSLSEEQEVLAMIADMVSDIYAMDSAIHRTDKKQASGSTNQMVLMTEVLCSEATERMVLNAKRMMGYVEAEEISEGIQTTFIKLPISNTIKKKRQIATTLIEQEEYTVS